ncbi:histidine kinase dimerization/phosphoacceptor domain -containing protein [Arcobacter sp. CECT 8983]|uniref:histidine kinase dimerization/phosphoacceptor domain -containing protein n=1 Tax=Arcobacter sp. CECT 8983 TaxID=2044508 RepID=UPI0013E95437|nr:histidine kinase dimerization/phosphoacceptor domain -containing protein [Arcobacter sp. CECT 8983]
MQLIPNMQNEQKKQILNEIENIIYLTTQQVILAEKAIKNNGIIKRDKLKSIMELEANKIYNNINRLSDIEKLSAITYKTNNKEASFNITILDKNKNVIFQVEKEDFSQIKDKLRIDDFLRYDEKNEYVCSSGIRKFFYTKKLTDTDKYFVLSCDIDKMPIKGKGLELNIKADIQSSFSRLERFHKGKTYLMWLNIKNAKENKVLYNKNDNSEYNTKYCLSRLSKFRFPKTGLLTGKEILNAIDKEPIKHLLDSSEDPGNYVYPTLTWVRLISGDSNEKFLYITSVYEKDFIQNIDSSLLKVLPAVIISFIIALIIGAFLFRRLFKSINILTHTSKQVNEGKLYHRNNLKGNDDIAMLANSFDKMLDSLEKNINDLDKKVEDKTKQLSNSLKEKETLLKEIHHRVKNNLAITINLIKLEKSKIKNKDTLDSLTNIQERIFVMELLHRKLYESENLSFISLKKYIKELTKDIELSYNKTNYIKINNHIDDINMDIDNALPCGIIITELITNCFKYAFNGKNGVIDVSFKCINNKCYLTVKDNGIGLDKNIDINNTETLGLQIISNIVKGQLFGEFKYSYHHGSKFDIIFNI